MYKHGDHRSVVGISILRVRDILCQDHKEPRINSFIVEIGEALPLPETMYNHYFFLRERLILRITAPAITNIPNINHKKVGADFQCSVEVVEGPGAGEVGG